MNPEVLIYAIAGGILIAFGVMSRPTLGLAAIVALVGLMLIF